MKKVMKNLWIIFMLGLVFVLFPAADFPSAQTKEPIRIGVISSMSGFIADWGYSERIGYQMAVEEYGGEVLGRPVTLIFADSEANPDLAARRARRLIEVDGCKFLLGGTTTSEALSTGAVAEEKKVLLMAVNCNGDQVTGEYARHHVFHVSPSFTLAVRAAAPWVAENLGKKWYFITHDYTAGHSATAAARESLKKVGGQDVGEIKVPTGTRDFSSQLLQVRNSGADVLVISVWGFDNVALLRQLAEFKIYDKMKVWYTLVNYVDLWAQKPEERLAYLTTETYYKENTEMEKFSERFSKKYPKAPVPVLDTDTWNGWLAVKILFEAIKKAGTADDVEKVICAMEGLTIKDNMRATPSFVRPWDHQVITQVDIAKPKLSAKDTDIWEIVKAVPLMPFAQSQEEKKLDISCNPNPKYKK